MLEKKPPTPLECLSFINRSLTPLYFAILINGIVEGLDDMNMREIVSDTTVIAYCGLYCWACKRF
jgi:hypothetical protein